MKKLLVVVVNILMIIALFGCDNSKEAKLKKIISDMPLEKKVAQMIMPSFKYKAYLSESSYIVMDEITKRVADIVSECGFGGILLFSGNIDNYEQTRNLLQQFREANNSGENIPLMFFADQEGGAVRRLDFGTSTPGNMALAATGNPENATISAEIIGKELSSLTIDGDFAPVVDINSNFRNPVIGVRSFGDNPEIVSEYAKAYIDGLSSQNVITTIKHFPGHGDVSVDSHTSLPIVEKTYEQIKEFELIPFAAGIEKGVDMIMTAHIQYPLIDNTQYLSLDGSEITIPATMSKTIISDILRTDMGFDGLVCTDALEMGAIIKYFKKEDIARMTINAGVDILLVPVSDKLTVQEYLTQLRSYITMIVDMVNNKEIDIERIDESVLRILKLKDKYGILDNSKQYIESKVGSKENHDLELELAKKAITLIKNENNVLPINEDDKTIIFVAYQSQLNAVNFALDQMVKDKHLSSRENIVVSLFPDTNVRNFKFNFEKQLKYYDKVVLVSTMYDYSDLNSSEFAVIDTVLEISKKLKKQSVVISAHLPYDLSRFETDGLIACYYGSGMPVVPENYDGEVRCYAPNLIAAIMCTFNESPMNGRLPVDVPELSYQNGQYYYSDSIKYEFSYCLHE